MAVLPVTLGWNNGWFISASVTTAAGLSDIFDGRVAKRLEKTTSLGAHLDLFSDKVFIGAMMVVLAFYHIIPLWMPIAVILREVAISLVRFIRFHSRPPMPDAWGKAKMAVSVVAIIWLLLQQDFNNGGFLAGVGGFQPFSLFLSLAPWIMSGAVALTMLSGGNYLLKYARK